MKLYIVEQDLDPRLFLEPASKVKASQKAEEHYNKLGPDNLDDAGFFLITDQGEVLNFGLNHYGGSHFWNPPEVWEK